MVKFDNIKVGDKVMILSEVRIGWGGGKSFWMPKTVDKVTPKQFVVGSSRYKKETGSAIGDYYSKSAKLIGEVKDETKERNVLVRKLNYAYEIKKIIGKVKVPHDHENLQEILSRLREVSKLL